MGIITQLISPVWGDALGAINSQLRAKDIDLGERKVQ